MSVLTVEEYVEKHLDMKKAGGKKEQLCNVAFSILAAADTESQSTSDHGEDVITHFSQAADVALSTAA